MVLKPAAVLKAEAAEEHRAVLAAAKRFAHRAQRELGATAVYLFGSRARGDWRRGSDCDLLVVSPRFAGLRRFERPVLMYELWDGPVSIEPWGVTPEELDAQREGGGLVELVLAGPAIELLAEPGSD
jgi:predicted nucleotidyltransferase